MISNLKWFCVNGNSILRVDTTFELVDGLWLTDSTYTNEALIDSRGKHLEFPGPSMWYFHKDQQIYRRFAAELVIQDPAFRGIRKIGHDRDHAIPNGLCDILQVPEKLWCTKHMMERDKHMMERDTYKFHKRHGSRTSKDRIMADIYGSQVDSILQSELADAMDDEDFHVKLYSLRES